MHSSKSTLGAKIQMVKEKSAWRITHGGLWSSPGVAYKDMLILFRMHTYYLSLPPGPELHTWKTSRPKGVAESPHLSRIQESMSGTGG